MKEKIGFNINTVSHMIRREVDERISKSGLNDITGAQAFIIGYLYANKDRDIFQRDLEKKFNLRRSSITSILNNLEKNEFIIRKEVDNDKRLKKVILTNKGIDHQDRIDKIISNFDNTLQNGFSNEEINMLFYLLGKIKENIEGGNDNEKK